MAKSADSLRDLIGARAGQAEGTFAQRGWSYVTGNKGSAESHGYWWHAGRKDCIKVTTRDGRYTAITDASASDCNQKSSGNGTAVAVAAVGAVALTALLMSRKSKNRPGGGNGYQPEWQQVEVHGLQSDSLRIFFEPATTARVARRVGDGTLLRNFGCDTYNGESWCEVATNDGRTEGWARDRYLRPVQTVNPGYPGGNWPGGGRPGGDRPGGNWGENGWGGDYRGIVEVYGLQSGSMKITADPSKDASVVTRVGQGTSLRSMGCRSIGGDNWCDVSTMNGRNRGWARERYLRRR
jgi:hypothetical protein